MARVRQVHFIAGYVFLIAFFWRTFWFFAGNRYARTGFPFVWRASCGATSSSRPGDYLRFDFGTRTSVTTHSAVSPTRSSSSPSARPQLLTGFALYGESNPGGFWDGLSGWVIPLLGGSARTHMWHHLFAWGFVFFTILHIYIVFLDARQYRNGLLISMITGMKFKRDRGEESDG